MDQMVIDPDLSPSNAQCLYKYVDQIDSAARLTVKRSAGVAPEVILRKGGLLKSMCQYTQRVSVFFQMANTHTRMCIFWVSWSIVNTVNLLLPT